MFNLGKFISTFLLVFSCNNLYAKEVTIPITDRAMASAVYLSGDDSKPLLIFVHGFLQTHNFSTVDRLNNALNEGGFPTLAITLSLGISNRKQAIACESLHLHSLQSDSAEINKWVKWATAQGHKEVVLIGHSAGSVNITAYLAQNPAAGISKTILISLTYYGPDRPAAFETKEHAQKAHKMIQQNNLGLEKFSLAFCKEYISTAENFLSYYNWSEQKVLQAINAPTSKNYIIIGGQDNRIGEKWANALQQASGRVKVIEGANHFFDQTHEFDLLETVEKILIDE